MKFYKYGPVVVTVLSLSSNGFAQSKHMLEVDATFGSRFGGSIDVELDHSERGAVDGRLSVDSSAVYGAIVGYRYQTNGFVYLSYSRQDTNFGFTTNYDVPAEESKGSIEYIQFGGNLEATRGRLTPYIGASVGTGHFSSHENGGNAWRFTAALDGGVKLKILPILQFRVLGRVPFTFAGGQLYCYSGYGCLAVSDGAPLVQGEVQGAIGLTF